MKHIKYLALFLFGALIFTSCIDNTAPEDEFTVGVNTVAFENRISSYSGIADGSSYSIELPMKLKGPSATDVTGDLTVNIAVSDASTAIEGTHFSLPQSSITLVDGQDHLGNLPLVMLTDGIVAPLEASPVLVLEITSVDGDGNVVADGGVINLTLNYACNSVLAGTYNVTVLRPADGASWSFPNEVITEVGVGQYVSQTIGPYGPGVVGSEGIEFTDVCDRLTVPLQDLNAFSNEVVGTGATEVDANGNFTLEFSIDFASGGQNFVSTYVKQ